VKLDPTGLHHPKNDADTGPGGGGWDAPAGAPSPHDAVGAYLLDALAEDERRDFARHLAGCADCQREAADLAPAVGVLPRLWAMALDEDLPAGAEFGADGADLAPSAGLRDRILAAARSEGAASATDAPAAFGRGQTASATASADAAPRTVFDPDPAFDRALLGGDDAARPEDARAAPPARPRGRIRPGVDRTGDAPVVVAPPIPFWRAGGARTGWLAAAALAIVAVGSVLWGLGLQSRLDDRRDEIADLRREVQSVRGRETASVFNLGATADGPAGATGRLVFTPGQAVGTLIVDRLPALAQGQVYQLWYLGGAAAPRPGPTFGVEGDGSAAVAIQTDAAFGQIALTAEPATDADPDGPTLPILMVGGAG